MQPPRSRPWAPGSSPAPPLGSRLLPRPRPGLQAPPQPRPTVLTDLQVGASFFSRKGMAICSRASRKNFLRTVLLS